VTLYLNGTSLGDLVSFDETNSNYVCEPESPQATPIPAYKAGRGHEQFTIGVQKLPAASFFALKTTLKGILDTEDVVYLRDSTFQLYNGSTGVWVVISEVRSSISQGSLGEISFTCTVTTDHDDSEYTPA
jgi:hypothetical protein